MQKKQIGKKEVFSEAQKELTNYGHFISRVGNILNFEQTLITFL